MAFSKKTLKDINLKQKTVLLRADFNVLDENGKVTEELRVKETLPTIEYLLQQNCKIVIISHAGRPEGRANPKLSLRIIATRLQKLLNKPVKFLHDCIGEDIKAAIENMKPGQIVLLENLRFHKEEEVNDIYFAKQLADLAEVMVQDGFGVVHRAHASTDAITKYIPAVAGLLLEKEVDTITRALEKPKRPLVAILGGAKVSDKIELLENFIDRADFIVIGGAMANTFLKAMGLEIGKSIYEESAIGAAKKILRQAQQRIDKGNFGFYLPVDALTAKSLAPAEKVVYQAWNQESLLFPGVALTLEGQGKSTAGIDKQLMMLDIGEVSLRHIEEIIASAKTVLWNGPVGYTELPQFSVGSRRTANAIIKSGAMSIIGGGDSGAFIEKEGLGKDFSWVSTGGGAGLELMAGKKLPGVEALLDK